MTARQIFEGVLIELSKVHASPLLLLDFNYLFNKSVNLYINKRYNIYDINQLSTDDLRVLKATTNLIPKKAYDDAYTSSTSLGKKYKGIANLQGATYEINLPSDYLHILNCICIYEVKKLFKCYDLGSYVLFAAKRLTADSWSLIVNDLYNRPLPERPYYYIHNVNKQTSEPTNLYDKVDGTGTDQATITKAIYDLSPILEICSGTNDNVLLPSNSVLYLALVNKKLEGITTLDEARKLKVSIENSKVVFTVKSIKYYAWYNTHLSTVSIYTSEEDPSTGEENPEYYVPVTATLQTVTAEFPRDMQLNYPGGSSSTISLVEKPANIRHSNASLVRCEIRYGKLFF